jgi:hypothetical protein
LEKNSSEFFDFRRIEQSDIRGDDEFVRILQLHWPVQTPPEALYRIFMELKKCAKTKMGPMRFERMTARL